MASLHELQLSLRPAVEDDVPYLIDLRHQSMDPHHVQAGVHESAEVNEARVRARFDCAKVICLAGERVGVIKVVDKGATLRLMQLQLMPQHLGRGIGAQLVQSVLLQARTDGKPVTLSVLKVNPAALRQAWVPCHW